MLGSCTVQSPRPEEGSETYSGWTDKEGGAKAVVPYATLLFISTAAVGLVPDTADTGS